MDLQNDNPFRLNFKNLDAATKEKPEQRLRGEVEQKIGTEIKVCATENLLDYNELLDEIAIKNLYRHSFTFTI